MKQFYLLLFCCFITFGSVHAKQARPVAYAEKKVRTDSSRVTYHRISEAEIKKIRKDPDFNYKLTPPERLSLWQRFWNWVWDEIFNAVAYGVANPVLRCLIIAIFAALGGYAIYRTIRSEKLFAGNSEKNNPEYDVYPDNIHNINYEQEIATLINEGKYRLAIRLLYLRSLKMLSDKQIITWQPDKTNYIYVNEIRKEDLQQNFKMLTLQFDYIWYGHFPVDAQAFEPLQQSFNDFNSMIK